MKTMVTVVALAVILTITVHSVNASGRVGVCAIVERVVFEPSEKKPERIQIWGAFILVNGGVRGGTPSAPRRGYLYFKLPSVASEAEIAKKEWNDLKAIAGKGQAVAFGDENYFGSFDDPVQGTGIRLHGGVLGFASPLDHPDVYGVRTGIVRLSPQGDYASVIKQLQETLKR